MTVHGCEENPCLWEEPQKDGSIMFGFGCYGSISGIAPVVADNKGENGDDQDLDDEEYDFDAFLEGLQSHIADDDAVVLLESGNEKLKYVTGYAVIVTSKSIESFGMTELAILKASEMLGNPDFRTRCEY